MKVRPAPASVPPALALLCKYRAGGRPGEGLLPFALFAISLGLFGFS